MPAERAGAIPRSLRATLLWWLIPPVLFVVVVSSFMSYTTALRYASDAYDFALFDSAKSLAEQLRFSSDGQPVLELPKAAEEILHSDPYDRIYYRVLGGRGETIGGHADLAPPAAAGEPGEATQYYDAKLDGIQVRVCSYTVFNEQKQVVAIVLVAETLLKRIRLSRSLLVTDFVLPLAVLPLLMGAIVWYGVRRGLRSLEHLTSALGRRDWSDLTSVSSAATPEEVRPLTLAIDSLMQRLGTALAAQRRFIGEAAHQLRTPLAGLAAQADRAQTAKDLEGIRTALSQLQVGSRRVARLVHQLLALAKAEPDAAAAHEMARLDLAAVVQRVCMDWVPEALQRGVDLGYEGDAGLVMIDGNEFLLAEMVNNLIDNALRYGARSGEAVTVRLVAGPPLVLSVEDDGQGIAEADRERVFERFYRVPGSPAGGSGLGLAIVREIARAHGASVTAQPRSPRGGAVFRVVFGDQEHRPGSAESRPPGRAAERGSSSA